MIIKGDFSDKSESKIIKGNFANFSSRQERIKEILLEHKGAKNAISSKRLGNMVGINDNDTTSSIREQIMKVATIYQLPVAANNNGYFIITNEEEFDKYIADLNHRIIGIQKRKELIKTNFEQYKKEYA